MMPPSLHSMTDVLTLFLTMQLVFHASANVEATKVLTMIPKLHIERNYTSQEIAQTLYRHILDIALPRPQDHGGFHKSLLELKAQKIPAVKERALSKAERVKTFNDLISENSTLREGNGIIRLELLDQNAYNTMKERINKVVENTVLDNNGTIHLYVSLPESSALLNHTDTTDIFVLQMQGAKEWLVCQEGPFSGSSFHNEKLNTCSTYDSKEMDKLLCKKVTLFAGDGMFLPRRIVHSARALNDGLSAHLTFAFANDQCEGVSQYLHDSSRRIQETCTKAVGGENCNLNCNLSCPTCNNGQNCKEGCTGDCNICNTCTPCSYGESCDEDCNLSCNQGCTGSCDLECDICNEGCNDCCSPPPCTCECDICQDGCNEGCDSDCTENCNEGCNESCDLECPLTCSPSTGSNCNEGCTTNCNLLCDICPACSSADGGTDCNEGCTFCPTDDWTCFCSPGCGPVDPPYPCLPGVEGLGFGFNVIQGEPTGIRIIPLKVGLTPKIYTDQTTGTMYTIPENVFVESKIKQDAGYGAALYQETATYREDLAVSSVGVGLYKKSVYAGNAVYKEIKSKSFEQRKILVEQKLKSLTYLAKLTDVIDSNSVLTPQAQNLVAGAPGVARVEQLGTHIVTEMTFGGQITARSLGEDCFLTLTEVERQNRAKNYLSLNFATIAAGRAVSMESSNTSCEIYLSSWSHNNAIEGGDLRVWDNTTAEPEELLQLWRKSVTQFPVVVEKRVTPVVSLNALLEADVNAFFDSKPVDEIVLSADTAICREKVANAGCESGAELLARSTWLSLMISVLMTLVLCAYSIQNDRKKLDEDLLTPRFDDVTPNAGPSIEMQDLLLK